MKHHTKCERSSQFVGGRLWEASLIDGAVRVEYVSHIVRLVAGVILNRSDLLVHQLSVVRRVSSLADSRVSS